MVFVKQLLALTGMLKNVDNPSKGLENLFLGPVVSGKVGYVGCQETNV